MRVSGAPLVIAAPVAPVVSRKRSSGSKDGSIAANCASVRPVNGGDGLAGVLGAPPSVGGGSVVYGVLFFLLTPMKSPVCPEVVTCCAAAKFGPGEPFP